MPKTFRHLWPQLVSFENLWLAYLAARRDKRARPAVAAFDLDAESRLLRLQEDAEQEQSRQRQQRFADCGGPSPADSPPRHPAAHAPAGGGHMQASAAAPWLLEPKNAPTRWISRGAARVSTVRRGGNPSYGESDER